jgi:hypothetical protein
VEANTDRRAGTILDMEQHLRASGRWLCTGDEGTPYSTSSLGSFQFLSKQRMDKVKVSLAKLARFLRMDSSVKQGSKEVKRLIIAVLAGNMYGVYDATETFMK